MAALLLSTIPLFLAAALYVAGTMLLGTSLPLRMAEEGFATATVGLVMVPYSFGFIAGSLTGPRLIARVGHIRVYAGFASVFCALALLHGAYVNEWLWALLRVLSGLCGALMITVIESWISARARPELRGRFMSLYMVTWYLAGSGGQLLVGLYAPEDFRVFSLAAGLLALSSVPLTLSSQPAPARPSGERLDLKTLYRASPIAVIGASAAGFAQSSFYQLGPLYIAQLGRDHSAVAHTMALAVLASMLLQYPLGRLADRSDRTRVIVGVAIGIALAAATVTVLAPHSAGLANLTTMLYCGLAASLYPTCVARLNERTGGLNPVAANATLLLCYGVGQFSGPVLSSALMGRIGPAGLFITIGSVLGLFAVWAALRRLRSDLPAGTRSRIVPVAPDSLPVVADNDPRLPQQPPPAPNRPPLAREYVDDDDP